MHLLSSWAKQFETSKDITIPTQISDTKININNINAFSQFLQLRQYRSENNKKSISDTTHNLINI